MRTFKKGGIHPPDSKLSAGAAIEVLPLPETVVVPLVQHIGAPATAEVAKGDKVVAGQLIARAGGFVSANIHSPVSGVVTAVEPAPNGSGVKVISVSIKVEGDEWDASTDRSPALEPECRLTGPEIVAKIADAGIVGMGGATFPTQVKLSPPPGKRADVLIINGVECEPYLTSDHRVMLEYGAQVLIGVGLLARALGVEKTYIGIENNKPDAIEALRARAHELSRYIPEIEIVPLKVHYPQGGEKQLIVAITGREVPSCALPIDVGVVVQNVGTALAVYEAVQKNKPLIERVVTITGKRIARPSNFLVRIGTPVSALIEAAGGLQETSAAAGAARENADSETGSEANASSSGAGTNTNAQKGVSENRGAGDEKSGGKTTRSVEPLKIIGGGPMMGRAMSNPDAPVTKGTSGILVMSGKEAARCAETACIKCGKCITVCPMGLEPYLLSRLAQKGLWAEAETGVIVDCIECGSCAYTCPARVPLLDWIRLGKSEVNKIIRARLNC